MHYNKYIKCESCLWSNQPWEDEELEYHRLEDKYVCSWHPLVPGEDQYDEARWCIVRGSYSCPHFRPEPTNGGDDVEYLSKQFNLSVDHLSGRHPLEGLNVGGVKNDRPGT